MYGDNLPDKLRPQYNELLFLKGRSLLSAGQFRKAADDFAKVLSHEPSNVWVRLLLYIGTVIDCVCSINRLITTMVCHY